MRFFESGNHPCGSAEKRLSAHVHVESVDEWPTDAMVVREALRARERNLRRLRARPRSGLGAVIYDMAVWPVIVPSHGMALARLDEQAG